MKIRSLVESIKQALSSDEMMKGENCEFIFADTKAMEPGSMFQALSEDETFLRSPEDVEKEDISIFSTIAKTGESHEFDRSTIRRLVVIDLTYYWKVEAMTLNLMGHDEMFTDIVYSQLKSSLYKAMSLDEAVLSADSSDPNKIYEASKFIQVCNKVARKDAATMLLEHTSKHNCDLIYAI